MAETDTEKEPQIKTIDEYHEQAPRRWPMLSVYVIATLIIAILLVFGARTIYRHYHHKAVIKTVPANTKELPKAPPATTLNNKSGTKSTGGTTANGSLPNSGPGQVVALFVGSSLAAGGAHFIISSQREKQS